MLAENEPVARLVPFEDFDCLLGEAETRHEVGHEGEPAAKSLGAFFFAVGLIDHAEYGRRVGVVDELVRQKRVQHDFDGRIWRRRIDEVSALDGDQLLVGERIERAELT